MVDSDVGVSNFLPIPGTLHAWDMWSGHEQQQITAQNVPQTVNP